MKEYMYNISGAEAIINDERGIVTVVVNEYGIVKEFTNYEKAIAFLERRGYRF